MQATLDASSLKRTQCFYQWTCSIESTLAAFTRAISCLARYGDELTICAYPDYFSFSATNSAKSAFCRFKYEKEFFSRYKVGRPRRRDEMDEEGDIEEVQVVKAQMLAKVRCAYTHIHSHNYRGLMRHRTCSPF